MAAGTDKRPVVFVVWDSQLVAAGHHFAAISQAPDDVDVEILGAINEEATGRLSSRLDDAVERSAAVLAIVDKPNANMAWELGMALARGRRTALGLESELASPTWLDDTPLGGLLRQRDIVSHARALLSGHAAWDPAPAPPTPGDRRLILCPPRGTGGEKHRALKQQLQPEGWELVDTRGWALAELGKLLDECGRVAWCQLALRSGEARHGVDNTINALVAGFAHARGIPVASFVHTGCPLPVDVRELERHHGDLPSDLVDAIRGWSAELDQPERARTRDLLDRYRQVLVERHAQPLAYVQAFDLAVAELQPVELDVDVGGPVDGLEARLHGWADRRHGTLDVLLHEDVGADAGPVRWLLQADPGAGKTTLLRRIAHQRAQEEALPVFVSLARWADEGGDPIELAARVVLDPTDQHLAPRVARAIRRQANRKGQVWLLFDGFDEVKEHEAVRRQLEAFAADDTWAHSAIVVTSRAAAVKGGNAWTDFTRASLRLLDQPRQHQLVAGLLAGHPGQEAAFWADVAARPGVGVLLPNPFLLTLTVGLFLQGLESGAGTPLDRRRLLQRAVKDCLERGWGVDRDSTRPDRWSPRYARRVLRGLSLELHRRGGESWDTDALSDALAELPRRYSSLATVFGRRGHWESDRVFLEDIEKYGGLMGPLDGPNAPWRYLHRSLREMLAAECLAEELDAAGRREVVSELMAVGEPDGDGPGRSADVIALLAGLVEQHEAVGHLELLASAAPYAGLQALASVEGLDAWRWLSVLLGMKAQREGRMFWSPEWSNDDLDTILDAIRRDGPGGPVRLWEAVTPDRPTQHLGLLWYALQRIDPAASLDRFLRACGRGDLARPIVPTCTIPAGDFQMGAAEADGRDAERPVHRVRLSRPFHLSRTPVTLAAFRAFDPEHDNAQWTDPAMPVVMVDWFTARLFAAWLGGRLPTEAEWEYACRAGTTTMYSSGDSEADLSRVGWYRANSEGNLQPVGQKPANAWGLLDMHGNAWEWCEDRPRRYRAGDTVDPAGGSHARTRVLRGGGCWYNAARCRSAARAWNHPADRAVNFGFRVVLAAPPPGRP